MIKKWRRGLWLAAIAGSLGLGAATMAQPAPFQPFKGMFGSKTPAEQKTPDPNRATEIGVELAWLSDPMTFPYYLEAHIKGSTLEVRGYVPTKAVRDQALNQAKLNTPLPVTDSMKEQSSLAIRHVPRTPDQLKSSVQTALRESFPGQRLTVQCQKDGNVQVSGTVRTLEQKLAVSQAMRRLHGCTSVTNTIVVGSGDVVQQASSAPSAPKTTVTSKDLGDPAGKVLPEQKRGGIFNLFAKTPTPQSTKQTELSPTQNAPVNTTNSASQSGTGSNIQTVGTNPSRAVKPGDPYESRGVVVHTPEEAKSKGTPPTETTQFAPTPKIAMPGSAQSAAQLKNRIETAIPTLRNVKVTFTSKTDVHIECTPRAGEDSGTVAGQIYALRDLEPYKVDLLIQLPMSEKGPR